jgi:hypothetical protein
MPRKCLEGCGVLFWGFLSQISSDWKSNRLWNREVIVDILMACVVLHNMIIENEVGENI